MLFRRRFSFVIVALKLLHTSQTDFLITVYDVCIAAVRIGLAFQAVKPIIIMEVVCLPFASVS